MYSESYMYAVCFRHEILFFSPPWVILTCSATVEDGFRFDFTPLKKTASKVGGLQTNYVL